MRPPEPVDLSVKELIAHLPELLEGREPILSRENVREYVRRDPAAGAALQAVAHVARSVSEASDWMHTLPAASAAILTRPVATAKKHFKKEMVDLMFAVALSEFEQATWKAGCSFDSCAGGVQESQPIDLEHTAAELAEALGLPGTLPAGLSRFLSEQRPRDPIRSGLVRTGHLMSACEELRPGRDGVLFYRRLVPQLLEGTRDPRGWVEFAEASAGWFCRKSGLCRAADDALHTGEFDLAVEMSELADWYSPSSWFPVYALVLIRCLTGDRQAMAFDVERFRELLSASDAWNDFSLRQVQLDHQLWSRAALDNPRIVEAAASRMPQTLAMSLEEVLP